MSKNYVQPGEVLNYTASADIASGDVVVVGARVGVALDAIASGDTGPLQVSGVFLVPKTPADTLSQGELLYWDASGGVATTTSSGNTLMGYCFAAAVNGDTTVAVKLNG